MSVSCSVSASNVVNDVLWKLDALQTFVHDLHWPDEIFACHIKHRLKLTASDMIQSMVARYVLGELRSGKHTLLVRTLLQQTFSSICSRQIIIGELVKLLRFCALKKHCTTNFLVITAVFVVEMLYQQYRRLQSISDCNVVCISVKACNDRGE